MRLQAKVLWNQYLSGYRMSHRGDNEAGKLAVVG